MMVDPIKNIVVFSSFIFLGNREDYWMPAEIYEVGYLNNLCDFSSKDPFTIIKHFDLKFTMSSQDFT